MGPQMLTTWGQRDTTTEQADKAKHSLYKNMLLLTPDQPALPARYYIFYNIEYIIYIIYNIYMTPWQKDPKQLRAI